MTDAAKDRFIADLGRAAEAVSGNTPPAAPNEASTLAYDRDLYRSRWLSCVTPEEAKRLQADLSAMESAKNDAMTLAYERGKDIQRLERELAEARRERGASDEVIYFRHAVDAPAVNPQSVFGLRHRDSAIAAINRHRASQSKESGNG